jgi:hypothetical protein
MKIPFIISILSISCLLNGGLLKAQVINGNSTNVEDSTLRGNIIWNLPDGLTQLIESYKKSNYASPGFEGYRVQVLSDAGNNAKDRAQSTLLKFEQEFPAVPVYLTYQQPNFKVRCGDYRTKAEARRLQNQINGQFPGAYIVRDFIKIP